MVPIRDRARVPGICERRTICARSELAVHVELAPDHADVIPAVRLDVDYAGEDPSP